MTTVNRLDETQWICATVQMYERPLCRYAYSLSGSLADAQDAVQETFLRLCKAGRTKVEDHEAAWLFRVCRSRVLDMLRKNKPLVALSDRDRDGLVSPETSPAENDTCHEAQLRLPVELNRLPRRQQEVIRLKFQQHLRYREIAQVMNISESHVGVLIHTGIQTLRQRMRNIPGVAT